MNEGVKLENLCGSQSHNTKTRTLAHVKRSDFKDIDLNAILKCKCNLLLMYKCQRGDDAQ